MPEHYAAKDFEDLYGAKQQAQIFLEEFAESQSNPQIGQENKRFIFGSLALKNHLLAQLHLRGIEGSLEEITEKAKMHVAQCADCHECYKKWVEGMAYKFTGGCANISEKLHWTFISSEKVFKEFRKEIDNSLLEILGGEE